MDNIRDRLWSVQDVADYLGIPPRTLYNWRCRGIGPRARRVGRYLRYEEHGSAHGSLHVTPPRHRGRYAPPAHARRLHGGITLTQLDNEPWTGWVYVREFDGNPREVPAAAGRAQPPNEHSGRLWPTGPPRRAALADRR